jgi:hypothetical protein
MSIRIAKPHSCALCKNRPIDFVKFKSMNYTNPDRLFTYKPIIKEKALEIMHEIETDEKFRVYRKCPITRWTKMGPFKSNDYLCFDSDNDAGFWIENGGFGI